IRAPLEAGWCQSHQSQGGHRMKLHANAGLSLKGPTHFVVLADRLLRGAAADRRVLARPPGGVLAALPLYGLALVVESEVPAREPPLDCSTESRPTAPALGSTTARAVAWVVESLEHTPRHVRS